MVFINISTSVKTKISQKYINKNTGYKIKW